MSKKQDQDDLLALTRTARETIRDMKAQEALLQRAVFQAIHDIETAFEEHVHVASEATGVDYDRAIGHAIAHAVEAVYRRFDKLADALMGEDRQSQRQGLPSLTEQAILNTIINTTKAKAILDEEQAPPAG